MGKHTPYVYVLEILSGQKHPLRPSGSRQLLLTQHIMDQMGNAGRTPLCPARDIIFKSPDEPHAC